MPTEPRRRRRFGVHDVVVYEGPSQLTGAPIFVAITGLRVRTHNAKTGDMAQVWILYRDLPPQEAKRQNLDDAICGDCELRGDHGHGSLCYVPAWMGPTNVWKAYHRGKYKRVTPLEAAEGGLLGRHLRISAYGDAAAVPFDVWPTLLSHVAGWVGYSHQWRQADQRLRGFMMASVSTVAAQHEAHALGWRTFRMRGPSDPLLTGFTTVRLNEFACPASEESGFRTTCHDCQLCRGRSSPARHVSIIVHGYDGVLANFYRSRPDQQRDAHLALGRRLGARP